MLVLQFCQGGGSADARFLTRASKIRQIIRLDPITLGEDCRAFDNVTQFAKISRPRILLQSRQCLGRELQRISPGPRAEKAELFVGDASQINESVASWPQRNRNN